MTVETQNELFYITFTVKNKIDYVRYLSSIVGDFARRHCKKISASNIELCLSEAVNNSIIYSNLENKPTSILIRLRLDKKALMIDVHDELPLKKNLPLELNKVGPLFPKSSLLSESGRGLSIIKSLMDHVEWVSDTNGKSLHMIKKWS